MTEMTDSRAVQRTEIISLLQSHGITPTQQRMDIAAILFARPQHVSAEQVLEMANKGGQVVSKATVYNTLNLFARKGMIREVIVDPIKVFYDSNTTEHHHFYNLDTGQLFDIPPGDLRIGSLPELPPGTTSAGVEIIVRVRSENHTGA